MKHFNKLLPLLISQLWIDRVCRINLGFNKTVCDNLNSGTEATNIFTAVNYGRSKGIGA
jgi:hypothetical protein